MRDKLIALLKQIVIPYWAEIITDHLIAHGVTLAEDNNVLGKKPLTNGDRIRAMTDEELAEWVVSFGTICEICSENTFVCDDETIACGRCAVGITNWLKQPAKEET